MTEEERRDTLRALEIELRGYEVRGLKDRAKEVEKAIAALTGETPVKRAERRPRQRGEHRSG